MPITIEKALNKFRTVIHWYANTTWGSQERRKEFYEESNTLCDSAKKEIKVLRQLQIELQWYRSRYPGPKNPKMKGEE